jgi:uncharacterized protein YkwD
MSPTGGPCDNWEPNSVPSSAPMTHVLRRSVVSALTAVLTAALSLAAAVSAVHLPAASAAPHAASLVGMNKKASVSTVAFTNRKRVARGVRSLRRVPHLDRVAAKQARRMAHSQQMFHNPNIATEMKNWCRYGENVAFGRSIRGANVGLWQSPGHRANMLNRGFDQMGSAVAVDSHGTRWVVQVFRKHC